MARVAPFETHTRRYERWFRRHAAAYQSELRGIRELLPHPGFALEVGVGTGRFAAPLGIAIGLDPSFQMLKYARRRGINCVCGVAEALPFRNSIFDQVLIVTTICFVDDPRRMLAEVCRVLRPQGVLVVGFIDRTSWLGQQYEAHRQESIFYREATFFSAREVGDLLADAAFGEFARQQTLTRPLAEMTDIEPPRPGVGTGAFVAVRAVKAPS